MLKLTDTEKLYLERRRLGETQVQAAKSYKVSLDLYHKWERGRKKLPFKPTYPEDQKLTENEIFLIKRRRSKLTHLQIAQNIGCCRRWVEQMELGKVNCNLLREYWKNRV